MSARSRQHNSVSAAAAEGAMRGCDISTTPPRIPHFRERDVPDEAVGPHADCLIQPEVLLYPPDRPLAAIERYRDRLAEHGGDPADAAVLARGNSLVDELNGDRPACEVKERPMHLGRAAAAIRQGTLTRRQLERVERIVSFSAWGEEALESHDIDRRRRLRAATMRLLPDLPSLDEDLRAWIQATAARLTKVANELANSPFKSGSDLVRSSSKQVGISARDAFTPPARELMAQTVHDIKGEDRDAVMIVIDRPRSRQHEAQVQLWTSTLAGEAIDEAQAEEKRIAFVALTRAQRRAARRRGRPRRGSHIRVAGLPARAVIALSISPIFGLAMAQA